MSLMIDGWMPSVGSSRMSAADGQLLLLAAGEIAAAPSEHVVENRKETENLVVDRALVARQAGESGLQVLLDRQQRENLAPLRHIAEPEPGALMRGERSNLLAVPLDRAGGDAVLAYDRAQ